MKNKQKPTKSSKQQPKDTKDKAANKSLFDKLIKKASQPLKEKKN